MTDSSPTQRLNACRPSIAAAEARNLRREQRRLAVLHGSSLGGRSDDGAGNGYHPTYHFGLWMARRFERIRLYYYLPHFFAGFAAFHLSFTPNRGLF